MHAFVNLFFISTSEIRVLQTHKELLRRFTSLWTHSSLGNGGHLTMASLQTEGFSSHLQSFSICAGTGTTLTH